MCSFAFFTDDKIVLIKKDFAFHLKLLGEISFQKGVSFISFFLSIISLTTTSFIRKANKTPF
jgi:hypothetical protein